MRITNSRPVLVVESIGHQLGKIPVSFWLPTLNDETVVLSSFYALTDCC